jgi:hypothetical protein
MSGLRLYVPITGWLRKKPKVKATPWAVIWWFDEYGRVLYVQPTHDVEKLLEHHKRYSHWHDEMTEVRWQWYPSAREARKIALRSWKNDAPVYSIWGRRTSKSSVVSTPYQVIAAKELQDRPAVSCIARRPRGLPAPGRLSRRELE